MPPAVAAGADLPAGVSGAPTSMGAAPVPVVVDENSTALLEEEMVAGGAAAAAAPSPVLTCAMEGEGWHGCRQYV